MKERACKKQAVKQSCSTAKLCGCLSWEKPRRLESWLGKICREKKSCLQWFVSYCVYESRLYIVLHKKELHQKCWSLLLISLLGKKLEGLNSAQLEWCGIPFNLMWHVFFFSLSVLTNGSCCLYVSGKAGLRNPLLCSTKSEVLSDGKSWSCYGAQLVLTPTEEAELQILNSFIQINVRSPPDQLCY